MIKKLPNYFIDWHETQVQNTYVKLVFYIYNNRVKQFILENLDWNLDRGKKKGWSSFIYLSNLEIIELWRDICIDER